MAFRFARTVAPGVLFFAALLFLALLQLRSALAADAQPQDKLEQRLQALEARVEELETRLAEKDRQLAERAAAVPAAAASTINPASIAAITPAAGAQSLTNKNRLEQRVAAVEQAQQTAPKIAVGRGKGLSVTSADGQYALSLRAYAQADNRAFFDGAAQGTDTFLVRTARPIIEAKLTDYFDARLMWDFGQGNARLLDGYADAHVLPGSDTLSLRMGEFKLPVGLERWQSEQELTFVERGQTTNLVPFRDIGVMAHGKPFGGRLEYELGVTNGATDLQVNTGDTDNAKDGVARILIKPFTSPALGGLALGGAATYGEHHGTPAAPGLTAGYLTTGQRTYFTSAAADFANGPDLRINPQLLYYHGSLGVMAEYVRETQDISTGAATATLNNSAWLASANYLLTGEKASFDGIVPREDFNPAAHAWGAFELAARYSALTVDSRTFPVFASAATQARAAREMTVGGNWYLNPAFKLNLDYTLSSFTGGNGKADRPDESAVLTRAQFRF
jgi:phosphate-selective porin OprO/OprP